MTTELIRAKEIPLDKAKPKEEIQAHERNSNMQEKYIEEQRQKR